MSIESLPEIPMKYRRRYGKLKEYGKLYTELNENDKNGFSHYQVGNILMLAFDEVFDEIENLKGQNAELKAMFTILIKENKKLARTIQELTHKK